MIEWVLTVAIAFVINGQTVWVTAAPEKAVYAQKGECLAAGRALKTPASGGVVTRVRCVSQRKVNTIIMPPFAFLPEEVEP